MTAIASRGVAYEDFLSMKILKSEPCGFFDIGVESLNPRLFDWQKLIVRWALRRGRAALFLDTGTGKTAMQLEWARWVALRTGKPVLILAPLGVTQQTVREGQKFGIEVTSCRTGDQVTDGLNITNYERLHLFDPSKFSGIVLDESSILKAFDGKTRKALSDFAAGIPFRLACTATPAPNDLVEITNHSEFLGIMSCKEVTGEFFRQDGEVSYKFRLKRHAHKAFYRWLASWAVALRKPSDLGFSDEGFVLPPIRYHFHTVEAPTPQDKLFQDQARGLNEQRQVRRSTLSDRVTACAELVNSSHEVWAVWCDLNDESSALSKAIDGAVEVRGSDSPDHKEISAVRFAEGQIKRLVTKSSIFGFGMNWQHCNKVAVVGLGNSFEALYQLLRRFWRFGQTSEVDCHFFVSEADGLILENIKRKEQQASQMMDELVKNTAIYSEVSAAPVREEMEYREGIAEGEGWKILLGDCVARMPEIPTDSVGLSVFSPPFPGMYVYSNTPRDMGNCHDIEEMIRQMSYMLPELLRITMPGRTAAVHLCQMQAFKSRDGYAGLKDFRGATIQAFEQAGWIYYGEVCIDKDPQYKAIRSKDNSLLFKTLANDAAQLRMASADYMLQFRKPGDNPVPIRAGISEKYNSNGWITSEEWIEWAAPVWYKRSQDYAGGIAECDVLNVSTARDEEDERHLCPLQLGVIERCIKLWSNPGEVVFSPFAGIGSELFMALKLGRRALGVELKPSYFEQAVRNCKRALGEKSQMSLEGLFE